MSRLKKMVMILNKNIQISCFCTSSILRKEVLKNVSGKSKSSQEWLNRQLNDKFVKRAKIHNFRSAFKLIEITEKYNILKPGDSVIDCGAAPGSWSQVAATKTNANQNKSELPVGKVIAIDLRNIAPISGVTILSQCDFTCEEGQTKLLHLLNGEKVNVVLSDMAPNATGIKEMDSDLLLKMLYKVLRFVLLNTKLDGIFLVKLWAGRGQCEFEKTVKSFFKNVRYVKPEASRSDSAELYLLACNFQGAKLTL